MNILGMSDSEELEPKPSSRLEELAGRANNDLHFGEMVKHTPDGKLPFIVEDASLYPEIQWLSGLVTRYRFVAGGCFRNIFMEEKDKIRDIDVWHYSKPDWEKSVYQFDRMKDYERKYETENAVGYIHKPTGMVVEVISRHVGTPEDILKGFDFSVAKFALYMDDEGKLKTVRHLGYFDHLLSRELSLHRDYEFDPDKLFNRIIKYAGYGFVPRSDLKFRLFQDIRAMENMDNLTAPVRRSDVIASF